MRGLNGLVLTASQTREAQVTAGVEILKNLGQGEVVAAVDADGGVNDGRGGVSVFSAVVQCQRGKEQHADNTK